MVYEKLGRVRDALEAYKHLCLRAAKDHEKNGTLTIFDLVKNDAAVMRYRQDEEERATAMHESARRLGFAQREMEVVMSEVDSQINA